MQRNVPSDAIVTTKNAKVVNTPNNIELFWMFCDIRLTDSVYSRAFRTRSGRSLSNRSIGAGSEKGESEMWLEFNVGHATIWGGLHRCYVHEGQFLRSTWTVLCTTKGTDGLTITYHAVSIWQMQHETGKYEQSSDYGTCYVCPCDMKHRTHISIVWQTNDVRSLSLSFSFSLSHSACLYFF